MGEWLNEIIRLLSFDPAVLARSEMIIRLSLQGVLLAGSAFFSGSETALFSISDVDLEQLRRQRHPQADLLHELLSQPRRLIVSILCGNELINIAATTNMAGIMMALYGYERAGVINFIVMVPLLLLLCEITPKTIAVSQPVQVSTRIICRPMSLWLRLIAPVRWVLRAIADRATTWVVGEARDVDHILRMSEFRSLVAEIEEEGLVSATDRVLIYNLLDAGGTEIEYIMTPRNRIPFARSDMSLREAADLLAEQRLMAIPVFQITPDDVAGFVHAADIAELVRKEGEPAAMRCADLQREALFVPFTKNTDEMLDFFQAQGARAAMVLDEFGGVAGMVTLEAVLNFIFGEIAGEFIDDTRQTQVGDNVFAVPGSMKLHLFEALTNFGIEDPRMTTIGGVVLRHLGRLPRKGDQVIVDGIRLTVLKMEGTRIARLEAAKLNEPMEAPAGD